MTKKSAKTLINIFQKVFLWKIPESFPNSFPNVDIVENFIRWFACKEGALMV